MGSGTFPSQEEKEKLTDALNLVEQELQRLERLARIDDDSYSCSDQDSLENYLTLAENTEDITCAVCQMEVEVGSGEHNRNLSDCQRHLCNDCLPHFLSFDEQVNMRIAYLRATGLLSDREIMRYRLRRLERITAKLKGLNFNRCHSFDCIGGTIVPKGTKKMYHACHLCGHTNLFGEAAEDDLKERESIDKLLEEGAKKPLVEERYDPEHPEDPPILVEIDDPENPDRGKFRPCPNCGLIAKKEGGCNAIICNQCRYHWHWNWGTYAKAYKQLKNKVFGLNPGGEVHDSLPDKRHYELGLDKNGKNIIPHFDIQDTSVGANL